MESSPPCEIAFEDMVLVILPPEPVPSRQDGSLHITSCLSEPQAGSSLCSFTCLFRVVRYWLRWNCDSFIAFALAFCFVFLFLIFFQLQLTFSIILYSFQVYSMVVRPSYTLQSDPRYPVGSQYPPGPIQLWLYHWLYSPYCTSHPPDYSVTATLYFPIPPPFLA